jgi:hypothetical protein
MGKGISVIVGRAAGPDGPEVPVYRALRDLLCSSCGSTIGEGALFTRRPLAGAGLRVAAQCRECAPFEQREGEREDGGKRHRHSPLMASLMAPETEGHASPESIHHGRVADDVMKRLGPALRYRSGKRGAGC